MKIQELIRSTYPKIEDMLFCKGLKEGLFTREEILKSEVVELYRASRTRTTIQNIYKSKLKEAIDQKIISEKDFEVMEEVIDDEGETDDHIDHIDMRYKLFAGTPITNKSVVKFHDGCEKVNIAWMSVCEESSLLYLMAAMAGIEDWYAPLSAYFEKEYRKRGFSDDELELFIVHKAADISHSEAQFDILERNRKLINDDVMIKTLHRTFATSKGYDALKRELALDKSKKLSDYFA